MRRLGGFAGVFALMVSGVPFLPATDRRAEKRCLADRWGSLGGADIRQVVESKWRVWSFHVRSVEHSAPVRIIAWRAPAQTVPPGDRTRSSHRRNEPACYGATFLMLSACA